MKSSPLSIPPSASPSDRLHLFAVYLLCAIPGFLIVSRTFLEAAVILISLLFLTRSVKMKDWSWLKDKDILLLSVIFLIMNLLVSPLAEEVSRSYTRSIGWLRFVLFYAAVTRWVLADHVSVYRFVVCLLMTLGVSAFDALYQLANGTSLFGQPMLGDRLTGPLARPNIGIYLAKLGFGAFALLIALTIHTEQPNMRRPNMKPPWLYGAALCVGVLALAVIFLSGERTASVLTLAALLLVLFGLAYTGRQTWRLVAMLTVLGSAGLAVLLSTSDRIWARVEALIDVAKDLSGSVYGEVMWIGLRIFSDHPITGAGMGNYPFLCQNYRFSEAKPATILGSKPECYRHPHNIYVEWLSDTGLICTVLFCTFVGLLLVWSLRALFSSRQTRLLGSVVLGVLLISYFPFASTTSMFSNWPAFLTWTSVASGVAALRLGSRGS